MRTGKIAPADFSWGRALGVGAGIGVLYWILQSGIGVYAYHGSGFLSNLLPPSVGEAIMRTLVVSYFIAFGAYAQSAIAAGRRAAVARLQESENRYRLLAENVSDVIWTTDLELRRTYVSPSVTRMRGFSVDESRDRPLEEDLTPDSRERLRNSFARELDAQGASTRDHSRPWTLELEMFRKDGSTLWVEMTISFLRDAGGQPAGLLGVTRDISLRKRAEAALEYRLSFEKLVASISTTFIHLNPDEVDRGIQRALEQIAKFLRIDRCSLWVLPADATTLGDSYEWNTPGTASPSKHLRSRGVERFAWWGEHLQRFEPAIAARVADLPPAAAAEREILEAHGIRSHILVPLLLRGRIFGAICCATAASERAWTEDTIALLRMIGEIVVNALERRSVEVNLARENARLASIIGGMEDGVALSDSTDTVIEANDCFCDFIGRPRGEVLGSRVEALYPVEMRGDLSAQLISLRLDPAATYAQQLSLYGREVMLRMRPVRHQESHVGVLINVVDVGDLVAARRQAEDALRTRSELLASISHEIRTPLNGIIGMTDITLETALSPEQRQYVEMAQRCAESLLSQINDVLDFSKIEACKLETESLDFDLEDLLQEITASLAIGARAKGLQLALSIDPAVPSALRGDPNRLRQIIVNLVGNAIKFTERGFVRLTVFTESLDENHVLLHFAVSDSGIGVPADRQEHIFEAFNQGDSSTTRKYGGTGLGLAISSELVQLMDGEIWVESPSTEAPASLGGPGSIFHFTARLVTRAQAVVAPPEKLADASVRTAAPSSEAEPERAPLRILLAEDNPVNQKVAARMLERRGHTTTVADNGRLALAALERQHFDLILMDVHMPELDGLETAQEIRRREAAGGEHIPIVAMTASATRADRDRCLQAGMDAFLAKPIRAEELYAMVESFAPSANEADTRARHEA